MENQIRYSDADLAEFKAKIDHKLAESREQLHDLKGRLDDLTDNTKDDRNTDYMDDSYTRSEIDTLGQMVNRTQKHIKDLENALLRIKNKVYGICIISGQLIDKRRLLAVPTTTKSLEAKMAVQTPAQPGRKIKSTVKPGERKIISKVIRKQNPAPQPMKAIEFTDDEDLNEIDDMDMNMVDLGDMDLGEEEE